MAEPESEPVLTAFEHPARLVSNGSASPDTSSTSENEQEDELIWRGVVAIDIPREVVARFSGVLLLSDLPMRQPEIVFDAGRQIQENDDE